MGLDKLVCKYMEIIFLLFYNRAFRLYIIELIPFFFSTTIIHAFLEGKRKTIYLVKIVTRRVVGRKAQERRYMYTYS